MLEDGAIVEIKSGDEFPNVLGVVGEYSESDGIYYVETYEYGIMLVLPVDLIERKDLGRC